MSFQKYAFVDICQTLADNPQTEIQFHAIVTKKEIKSLPQRYVFYTIRPMEIIPEPLLKRISLNR
jgi:hypothetical protein